MSTQKPEVTSTAPLSATTATTNSAAPSKSPASTKGRTMPRILGVTHLICGERLDLYNELYTQIFQLYAPRDVAEEIYLHQYVELTWQTLRERRLASGLISFQIVHTLRTVIFTHRIVPDLSELISAWSKGEQSAIERVTEILELIGVNVHTIVSKATAEAINDLDRLDAITARKLNQSAAILREFERHRALVEERQKSADKVIDAEFANIDQTAEQPQLTANPQDVEPEEPPTDKAQGAGS
jgi:hypothetical protein